MSAFKSWHNRKSSQSGAATSSANPFDETNKLRLEQSVLSPNIFHIASNHSSTERNSTCIWNIDQRAVLYPADIPTDENSLIPQYLCDHKINKQINAAVEAFWSQNMTVIESPLTNAASLYKARMLKMYKNNSNYNSPCDVLKAAVINKIQKNQEMIHLHPDFEIDKIDELKEYFQPCSTEKVEREQQQQQQGESPAKEILNTSIRKKLFDQNNDDIMSHDGDLASPNKNDRRNSLGYQDQPLFSPCFKHNLMDIDVNTATPDVSPFILRKKTEKIKFQFHDFHCSPIQNPDFATAAATTTTTTTITSFSSVSATSRRAMMMCDDDISPIKENNW